MKNSILNLISRATLLFSLIFCLITRSMIAQDTWTQKSDLGYNTANVTEHSPRTGAVGFSIGSKGYIGTGNLMGNYFKDFWEYDPEADTWTQKADFGGTARTDAVGFTISNRGYLGTGCYYDGSSNYFTKDFWEYDPDGNTWTQKADFGGTNRAGAVGFCIDSKGYVGTGFDFESSTVNTYYRDFWEYDPVADAWIQKSDFGGIERWEAVGFSIESKGYVGTGSYFDQENQYCKDFWEYDPVANSWTQKADFGGLERWGAVSFGIDKKGYVGTGHSNLYPYPPCKKDLWEYDPAINTWNQKTDFAGYERFDAVGFSIGSKGYVGTGYWTDGFMDSHIYEDFWEYDAVDNSWIQRADFGETKCLGAVAFSISGKGYVGTGGGYAGYANHFWEYDPSADAWKQKADFIGGGRSGAVGFSIGDRGYLGTGYVSNGGLGGYLNDFWEYNPAGNTWIQKADFPGGALSNGVGFSISGKGYVGTGNGFWYTTSQFWEYDPVVDSWTQKADFGGGARTDAAGFSIGNKGYLGAGNEKDFWEYDPVTNEWTQKADFGGTARNEAVGFSIGNKGYLGTGEDDVFKKDFWEYDPGTDTWTQKTDFGGTARTGAVGFSIGNKGYLGTGRYQEGFQSYYENDLWEYTPALTGIEELSATDSVSIYPNPVNDLISFEFGSVATAQAELFIYNSTGVLLQQITASHSTLLNISVDDIGSDGMYFYTLRTDDQQFFSGKFIIQR
ncbi:MAG: T9SS type A sorting domain-containing protein [Chitinophagaceae bacterium]|nr:T9SS type A sorting domain-containing protein [Chitinophagaceae bacterium]